MARNDDGWPARYTDVVVFARGTFGQVAKATDVSTGRTVAIKEQVTDLLDTDGHKRPILALRAYRELLLLKTFRGHKNVVYLIDVFAMGGKMYIVTDKVDMDLSVLMKRRGDDGQPSLKREMVPFIMYSILCGIKFIHSGDIIHRDLTPANIGISFREQEIIVKLLDFGLSRKLHVEMSYVHQLISYRAPDVLFAPRQYTKAIDIWSVGCIFAELITGDAVVPATVTTSADLLRAIFCRIGDPNQECVSLFRHEVPCIPLANMVPGCQCLFPNLLTECKNTEERLRAEFTGRFTQAELPLMRNMLTWDPTRRLTARNCLRQPYFAALVKAHGEGTTLTPDQDFEEWEGRDLQFWTGWFEQQVDEIKRNL